MACADLGTQQAKRLGIWVITHASNDKISEIPHFNQHAHCLRKLRSPAPISVLLYYFPDKAFPNVALLFSNSSFNSPCLSFIEALDSLKPFSKDLDIS